MKKPINLIGISGHIGSGKDTVAKIINYLIAKYDAINDLEIPDRDYWINISYEDYYKQGNSHKHWKIKKFADTLKDIVCLLIGCTRLDLEDYDFKNKKLGEEWDCYQPYSTRLNKFIGNIYQIKSECDEEVKKKYTTMIEDNVETKIRKLTPRLLMQLIGTDCMRNIVHPNLWVNSLFNNYKELKPVKATTFDYINLRCMDCEKPFNGYKHQFVCNECYDTHNWLPNWIITDLRFPNELEAIKSRGGICIRVDRSVHASSQENHAGILHPSETSLDSAIFNYTINNNSDIDSLIEKVKEVLIKENII